MRADLQIAFFLAVSATWALNGITFRLTTIYVTPPRRVPLDSALRIGLLGAAGVAPHALLYPSLGVNSVRLVAVGARSTARAQALASKWNIPKHGTYADVLSDLDVDAVYIALINGAHYHWAAAALRAGKHVLLEKPLTNNAEQAIALAALAKQHGRVLIEGFHNLHHPLATRLRELVRSGELGRLSHLHITSGLPAPTHALPIVKNRLCRMLHGTPGWYEAAAEASGEMGASEGTVYRTTNGGSTPSNALKLRPAKMNLTLGGGRFLSQGCYAVSLARFLASTAEDLAVRQREGVSAASSFGNGYAAAATAAARLAADAEVESAVMLEDEPGSKVDVATIARLRFPRANVTATLEHSSLVPGFDAQLSFTGGEVTVANYLFPFLYHHLKVMPHGNAAAGGKGATPRFEQHYSPRVPTDTEPTGCARLRARREWGALLGPVYSCAIPEEAAERFGRGGPVPESSFALQLRAFAASVALHDADRHATSMGRQAGEYVLATVTSAMEAVGLSSWWAGDPSSRSPTTSPSLIPSALSQPASGVIGARATHAPPPDSVPPPVGALPDVSAENAVPTMVLLDAIYDKARLGRRPGVAAEPYSFSLQ